MNAAATKLAAMANHFICWRSTPLARRKRTTMLAAAATRLSVRIENETPTSAAARSPANPCKPQGLGTDSKTLRFLIFPGANAMSLARKRAHQQSRTETEQADGQDPPSTRCRR